MSERSVAHFGERYGGEGAAPRFAQWNEVIESLLGHRSVRRYLQKPLPEGTLELLVAAAQSAPSSSNLQLWSVLSVQDPDRRRRLAELAGGQEHVRDAGLFLVWLADLRRLGDLAKHRGAAHEGLDYLEMFVMAVVDAALAAQNALVAAESLGLGTVYIGALRNHPEAVAAELGLPAQVFAAFGLCVGWPDPAAPASIKPRLPQSVVLHHEQYGAFERSVGALDAYDRIMDGFYTKERMGVQGSWSHHSAARVASALSLRGRDRLRAALSTMGFALR
ncbi:nitroreductase [Sorangium cellulosum]|uniref:Nitroreductase n=1 Tax=Sorangium cellulosum TaxID=56 RepID=A0A2L0ES28_SORCE|nr:NADPH-dependent oxidoreductase [Sorangium cellulosum]AUX42096.1 nitroreductase [Sorangium cellulosum]